MKSHFRKSHNDAARSRVRRPLAFFPGDSRGFSGAATFARTVRRLVTSDVRRDKKKKKERRDPDTFLILTLFNGYHGCPAAGRLCNSSRRNAACVSRDRQRQKLTVPFADRRINSRCLVSLVKAVPVSTLISNRREIRRYYASQPARIALTDCISLAISR